MNIMDFYIKKTGVLDLIGNTPLLSIGNIYFKMEMMNPSGSIKDRIAKEMILPYIGDVHKNFTIVEATSGNTGISVAMVCAALRLKCWIICPVGTSPLKIKLMRQYGAKINTAKDIEACIQKAKKMVKFKQADIYLEQFSNFYNIDAQIKMAYEARLQYNEEIYNTHWSTSFHSVDAIVTGVGTGGTLMGLHEIFPEAEIFMVQVPDGDVIEGICDGVKLPLIPKDLQLNSIIVTYDQAKATANMLMLKHGISCGISSGANYFAACMIRNKYKSILTVFADDRIRYL